MIRSTLWTLTNQTIGRVRRRTPMKQHSMTRHEQRSRCRRDLSSQHDFPGPLLLPVLLRQKLSC